MLFAWTLVCCTVALTSDGKLEPVSISRELGRHFIRARDIAHAAGPSSVAFYPVGDVPAVPADAQFAILDPLSAGAINSAEGDDLVDLVKQEMAEPETQDDRRRRKLKINWRRLWRFAKKAVRVAVKLLRSAEATDEGQPVRIEYKVEPNGEWQHAGDFGPGQASFEIPRSAFPAQLDAGTLVPVRFRTFNGAAWTPESAQPVVNVVVNNPPSISQLSARPLMLEKNIPSEVSLPIRVSDADGDPTALILRFDDGSVLTAAPHTTGENVVLPASAFEGHLTPGAHSVEILGFDGLDVTPRSVGIGYVVGSSVQVDADEDEVQDAKENAAESKGLSLGGLSPEALAGIVVGTVALIGLAVGVFVLIRRKKKQSSSTGLIDPE
jgi:hypothetical protein